MEMLVGKVAHYYPRIAVAALNLEYPLHVGDRIHVIGHTTNFEETVDSMEIDHQRVREASAGEDVAIGVVDKVRDGDKIYVEMTGLV
jgi:putative protease